MKNREIKFRAFDTISNKIIDWDELTHYKNDLKLSNLKNNDTNLKWMQYTGLKDKNGKEIYEGDIVYRKDTSTTGKVLFSQGKWIIEWFPQSGYSMFDSDLYDVSDLLEIKGNIYENT